MRAFSTLLNAAVRSFVLGAMLVVLVVGCSHPPPRSPLFAAEPVAVVTPASRAHAYLALLESGRFEEANRWDSAELQKKLGVGDLRDAWDKTTHDSGALVALRETHAWSDGAIRVVETASDFERGTVEATVKLNRANEVTSIWFGPLHPTWHAPAYVDAAAFSERDIDVGIEPRLSGTLTLPKTAGKVPIVILVHGSGPNSRDEDGGGDKLFKDLAWGLASRGIAVLRYEKRSRQYRARESILGYDAESLDDARAAVTQVRELEQVDARRVFVLGHSLGAALAPRIAATTNGLAGIVMLSGPTRPIEQLHCDQLRYLMGVRHARESAIESAIADVHEAFAKVRKPGPPDEKIQVMGVFLPRVYLLEQVNYDPVKIARDLTLPIFVLQGERDYQVTAADDYRGFVEGLKGHANVAFRLYPGLNHHYVFGSTPSVPAEYSLPGHVPANVIDDIAAWITSAGAAPKS